MISDLVLEGVMTKKPKDNVIDLTEKIAERNGQNAFRKKFEKLKVSLELEQAKVIIPASIMSILVVVTIINSKMLDFNSEIESASLASASVESVQQRGIASIPTGTSDKEDKTVHSLAIAGDAVLGQQPTALERFKNESLGGQYTIRSKAGYVSAITLATKNADPVAFNLEALIKTPGLFPKQVNQAVKVAELTENGKIFETYRLVDHLSIPQGELRVELDQERRLLDAQLNQAVEHRK